MLWCKSSTDMSAELASIGNREAPFPLPHGRGDEFHHDPGTDARNQPPRERKTRDIFMPDLRFGSTIISEQSSEVINVKTRDFR